MPLKCPENGRLGRNGLEIRRRYYCTAFSLAESLRLNRRAQYIFSLENCSFVVEFEEFFHLFHEDSDIGIDAISFHG